MRLHPRPVEAVVMQMMVAAEIGWHGVNVSRSMRSRKGSAFMARHATREWLAAVGYRRAAPAPRGIVVVNATTGQHESGATIVVKGLSVYDSVTAPHGGDLDGTPVFPGVDYMAWENRVKGGVYSVSVRKAGFVRQDLQALVPSNRCHSGPGPQLEVRLEPE